MRMLKTFGTLTAIAALGATPALADGEIVIGFATAESGFMQAYDKPAQDAAMIRIDEINKAGGLLGKQIKVVTADTKTDQAEGAKAGLAVLDQGAELVIVSCDYDFGSGAALQAEAAGKVSFFLCAESIKAGIPGVGPHSFSASVLAAVQGSTMAEAKRAEGRNRVTIDVQSTRERSTWGRRWGSNQPVEPSAFKDRPSTGTNGQHAGHDTGSMIAAYASDGSVHQSRWVHTTTRGPPQPSSASRRAPFAEHGAVL